MSQPDIVRPNKFNSTHRLKNTELSVADHTVTKNIVDWYIYRTTALHALLDTFLDNIIAQGHNNYHLVVIRFYTNGYGMKETDPHP